jgi:hypothetical protein
VLPDKYKSPFTTALKQIVGNANSPDAVKDIMGKSWKKLFSYKSADASTKDGLTGTTAWKKMMG